MKEQVAAEIGSISLRISAANLIKLHISNAFSCTHVRTFSDDDGDGDGRTGQQHLRVLFVLCFLGQPADTEGI